MTTKPERKPLSEWAVVPRWVLDKIAGDVAADLNLKVWAVEGPRLVMPQTEDECRAEFIKWARGAYEERQCVFDPQGVFFNPEVAVRWGAWLACARAMGAVK